MITTIILNGPPGCGKDSIANLLVENNNATKHEFKAALYEKTAKFFEIDLDYFIHIATSRKYKDNLLSAFSCSDHLKGKGYTPREALIYVSEQIYKPAYGNDYFGKLSAERLTDGLNVFSDGGFGEEVVPVAEVSDKLILCRLYREGFNFDGDSRKYFDDGIIENYRLENTAMYDIHLVDGKPELAVNKVLTAISK